MSVVRAYGLRWVHLLLGGALLMPYFLLSSVLLAVTSSGRADFSSVRWQFAAYVVALVMVSVTGFSALVRTLSVGAVLALSGVHASQLEHAPATSWAARRRAAAWLVLHTGLGALVSGMTLSLPPAVVVLVALPADSDPKESGWAWSRYFADAPSWLPPLAGLGLLVLLLVVALSVGLLLRRLAPVLLGPTPADRLATAERRAMWLAERNRIARELHDSVGHALSTVTLQAGAARKVLDRDPEFAAQALGAIEETSRQAVAELDSVLGLLREDSEADQRVVHTAGRPDLGALDDLVARTRAAGVSVSVNAPSALGQLPPALSQEAYRIVQEGLTNATRHAGPVPVSIELAVTAEELTILVENELPTEQRPTTGRETTARDGGGGRGVPGIAERAMLLGGSAEAGPGQGVWRLTVRLPLGGSR